MLGLKISQKCKKASDINGLRVLVVERGGKREWWTCKQFVNEGEKGKTGNKVLGNGWGGV